MIKMMMAMKVKGAKSVDQIENNLHKEDLEMTGKMLISITEKTTIIESIADNHHPIESIQEIHHIKIEGHHLIEEDPLETGIIVIDLEKIKDAIVMIITHLKGEIDLCPGEF